jgi:hypothetical protein
MENDLERKRTGGREQQFAGALRAAVVDRDDFEVAVQLSA